MINCDILNINDTATTNCYVETTSFAPTGTATLTVKRCRFLQRCGNFALGFNGAPTGAGSINGNFENCLFVMTGNLDASGRGLMVNNLHFLSFKHCTFIHKNGGMIFTDNTKGNSTCTVENCVMTCAVDETTTVSAFRTQLNSLTKFTSRNNVIKTLMPYSEDSTDPVLDKTGDITNQDPGLVAKAIDLTGDFHLTASSPAVNSGADLGITDDLDGNVRPYPGTNPDRGAYESAYGAATPTPTDTPTPTPTDTPTPTPTDTPTPNPNPDADRYTNADADRYADAHADGHPGGDPVAGRLQRRLAGYFHVED